MNLKNNNGNVLFLILIAVALFAALSYAVSSSSRTGNNAASEEVAKSHAGAILSYASAVTAAIERLRIVNGCTVEMISFENPIVTGYANANSPSAGNRECWVFDKAGGNVVWQSIDKKWQDPTWAGDTFAKLAFPSMASVRGVGLSSIGNPLGTDLILIMPYLTQSLCLELAKKTGTDDNGQIAVVSHQSYLRSARHQGAMNWNSEIVNSTASKSLFGHHEGCFQTPASSDNNFYPAPNTYHFFRVVMAR